MCPELLVSLVGAVVVGWEVVGVVEESLEDVVPVEVPLCDVSTGVVGLLLDVSAGVVLPVDVEPVDVEPVVVVLVLCCRNTFWSACEFSSATSPFCDPQA